MKNKWLTIPNNQATLHNFASDTIKELAPEELPILEEVFPRFIELVQEGQIDSRTSVSKAFGFGHEDVLSLVILPLLVDVFETLLKNNNLDTIMELKTGKQPGLAFEISEHAIKVQAETLKKSKIPRGLRREISQALEPLIEKYFQNEDMEGMEDMRDPIISNPNDFSLSASESEIICAIFKTYSQVILQKEITVGFNGRVFLARPIRLDKTAELPVVLKIAPINLIRREAQAYDKLVRDLLPNVPKMKGAPVFSSDNTLGGICYELVGSGRFEIESLYNYCQHNSPKEIEQVMKQLFRIIEPWWNLRQHLSPMRFQDSYDRMLPVNWVVHPESCPPDAQIHVIEPGKAHHLKIGDWVRIEGGVVKKVDMENSSVLLNLPDSSSQFPTTYHIRLENVQTIEFYALEDKLKTISGKVVATRIDLLQVLVREILSEDLDITAETISLPEFDTLPNPLLALPKILQSFTDVKVAHIHGDLNLENILVDEMGSINLIDFGLTSQDHILHDLLRLEAEVMTKLVPNALQQGNLPLSSIVSLYEQLHDVQHGSQSPRGLERPFSLLYNIRETASRYLIKRADWREYYQGLIIYLMGFLRFKDLDDPFNSSLPRQIAFYGAAIIQQLLEQDPEGNFSIPRISPRVKKTEKITSSFQALINEKTARFVGREHVFRAIEAFIQSQPNGYFIIEGEPGIGKSAILAEYVRRTGHIAHFNIRSQSINRPAQFLENVCKQLIDRYKLPYQTLPPDATQDGNFLLQLISEIRDQDKTGRPLVIAIDALDEVEMITSSQTSANILYLPPYLPEGVYFVMTRRPKKNIPLVVYSPIEVFDLMESHDKNLQDVRLYIEQEAQQPRVTAWIHSQDQTIENFTNILAEKSEDNFMYLRHVLYDIEVGKYQDEHLEKLPTGLNGYYHDHWVRMGMMEKPVPETKLKIIYILAEVREPVSLALAADFASESPPTVQSVLDEWCQFLHEHYIDEQTRYSIYHTSFSDFLHRKEIVQATGFTIKDINARIADNLWNDFFGESPELSNEIAGGTVTLEGISQQIDARFDNLDRTIQAEFRDVKHGQRIIYRHMQTEYHQPLEHVLNLVEAGHLTQGEMERTLDAIRRALRAMLQSNVTQNKELQEVVTSLMDAIESKVGIQKKLELTLPIIPVFLGYKMEIAAGSEIDLRVLKDEIRSRWSELVEKSHRNNDS